MVFVVVATYIAVFSRILLFIILFLYSIMGSKHKYKSDNEAKSSCEVMTLDERIKYSEEAAHWYMRNCS